MGKSILIQERLKTQSGEESSSSGSFNAVGRPQEVIKSKEQEATPTLFPHPSLHGFDSALQVA